MNFALAAAKPGDNGTEEDDEPVLACPEFAEPSVLIVDFREVPDLAVEAAAPVGTAGERGRLVGVLDRLIEVGVLARVGVLALEGLLVAIHLIIRCQPSDCNVCRKQPWF